VKTCSVRGIAYPNASYLSQKVMSEVSVSRSVGVPRLGQPWLLTCTPSFSGSAFEVVKKHERHSGGKDPLFFEEKIRRRGGCPLLAPEGGSGFAEARLTLP
jgi:hypothetical protein